MNRLEMNLCILDAGAQLTVEPWGEYRYYGTWRQVLSYLNEDGLAVHD